MSSDEAFVIQVLAGLAAVHLEAVIVGNVAAVLQGAPVTTADIDLLVRDTPTNRKKIAALGETLGGKPRRISPLTDGLRIDLAAGTVDLLFDQLPGQLSFQSLRSRAVHLPLGRQTALVAALADVIASKEAADRPKDRAQLPILRDTLKVKGALETSAARRPKPKR
jgi:hypothetical protein